VHQDCKIQRSFPELQSRRLRLVAQLLNYWRWKLVVRHVWVAGPEKAPEEDATRRQRRHEGSFLPTYVEADYRKLEMVV
jgi:hypothetical protein